LSRPETSGTGKRRIAELPDDLIVAKPSARVTPPPADVRQRGAEETDDVHLTFSIPRWLRKQIKQKAAADSTTVRAVLMKALQDAGYPITDDDLVDRRGGGE